MNTSDLTHALRVDADLAGPPPADLMDRIDAAARARRRRVVSTGVAVVVAALVALAVPTVTGLVGGDRGAVASGGPGALGPVTGAPTRGSLAQDTDLVRAVRGLDWPELSPADAGAPRVVHDPAPQTRRVVFLGDVAGTRYALVAGQVSGPDPGTGDGRRYLVAVWLTGPVGAAAGDLAVAQDLTLAGGDRPLAFVDTDAATPVVLAVGAPGDEITFSDLATLQADGTVRRDYEPGTPVADGVASHPTSADAAAAVSARVTRDDVDVLRWVPDGAGDSGGLTPGVLPVPGDPVDYADPRGVGSAVADLQPQVWAMFTALGVPLQVPVEDLRPTLLWAGPLPDGSASTAVVVGVTAPSGASAAYALAFDAAGNPAVGGWSSYPAEVPLTDSTQLVRLPAGEGGTGDVLLLVTPLTATGEVRATLTGGEVPPDQPVDGAVLVLPDDPGVDRATVTAAGAGYPDTAVMDGDFDADPYDYGPRPR